LDNLNNSNSWPFESYYFDALLIPNVHSLFQDVVYSISIPAFCLRRGNMDSRLICGLVALHKAQLDHHKRSRLSSWF